MTEESLNVLLEAPSTGKNKSDTKCTSSYVFMAYGMDGTDIKTI